MIREELGHRYPFDKNGTFIFAVFLISIPLDLWFDFRSLQIMIPGVYIDVDAIWCGVLGLFCMFTLALVYWIASQQPRLFRGLDDAG